MVTNKRLGGGGPFFALTRWDRSKPATVSNLILLSSAALADQFDSEVRLSPVQTMPLVVVAL